MKNFAQILVAVGIITVSLTGCAPAPVAETAPTETSVVEQTPNNVLTDDQIDAVIVKLWGNDLPFDREKFFDVMHSLDSNDASFIYGGALHNSVDIDEIEVLLMDHGLEFAEWYPAG